MSIASVMFVAVVVAPLVLLVLDLAVRKPARQAAPPVHQSQVGQAGPLS